jgi:hypothetical protein
MLVLMALAMMAGIAQASTVFAENPAAHGLMVSAAVFALLAAAGLLLPVLGTTLAVNERRTYELGDIEEYGVIASDIIYEGAAVGDNGSGYARPLVAGDPFLGFAESKADNSATATDGYIRVRVLPRGKVRLPITSLAITDRGKSVYASDDNTFTLTKGSNTYIGYVERWDVSGYGIVVYDASPERDTVGAFGSTTSKMGNTISSARTSRKNFYGDDGAAALTAGAYRTLLGRLLVNNAIASGDTSIFGAEGHLKVNADITTSAHQGGLIGKTEVVAGKTLTSMVTGVMGSVELPSTAVIASGYVLSAFRAWAQDLGGTHTGKAAIFDIPNPVSGTWDFFFHMGSAPGGMEAKATALSELTSSHRLICRINTTTVYIPIMTTWS